MLMLCGRFWPLVNVPCDHYASAFVYVFAEFCVSELVHMLTRPRAYRASLVHTFLRVCRVLRGHSVPFVNTVFAGGAGRCYRRSGTPVFQAPHAVFSFGRACAHPFACPHRKKNQGLSGQPALDRFGRSICLQERDERIITMVERE